MLRLWSAGCATGEEAYTLAILALLALRDAGFAEDDRAGGIVCRPPWRLDVLGTDISRLVLAQAEGGGLLDRGAQRVPRPAARVATLLSAAARRRGGRRRAARRARDVSAGMFGSGNST